MYFSTLGESREVATERSAAVSTTLAVMFVVALSHATNPQFSILVVLSGSLAVITGFGFRVYEKPVEEFITLMA